MSFADRVATPHVHPHTHEGEHDHPHLHLADAPEAAAPEERWVELEHVHYVYPDGTEALRGVDLSIARGEKVALIGPNGAGKSTLMLHLNGILLPAHGRVRVAGMTVGRDTATRVRAQVGLVFQDPDDQLFSPTVFEDVAFGPLHMGVPEEEIHARVEAALAAVGMTGFQRRRPQRLSLGQRKRVAIATVLSMDPSVLVFDEPSAGLDPRGRRELIGLLRELPQTQLVATHDMRLVAEVLPRSVVMDAGLVVADGPTEEILADEALLEAHGLERP
ncbi:MAG TPA: ATP-binding cassette domain-containing protein [candidate division Zixibacteria bacterium]|nr:ATP-binding cassette domain-containing protein [candidate division Zixibacteria bacterium]